MGLVREQEGTTVGTYVLERKLGAGGMAEVYLARRSGPRGFTKRVALKRILPELSEDSQLIQMFCDEARVAGTLSHPNIAQVIEFGEHDGEFFIVMEYVDGVSCSALLRAASQRGETLPLGAALYVAREILLALAFAHEATDEAGRALGIVHRDVSPSNVLVSRVGNVKLIDFGITRSFLAERRTHPGELKGKLRYMSPEQILGAEVDARSDLFAVGIVLTEMIAGRALFSGKSELEVLTRISRGELGLVRDGGVPKDVAELLEKALAHRPGERFQTARDFANAIEEVASSRGLRLDDTTILPYMHELGVLPSTSGTRPSIVEREPVPAANHSPLSVRGGRKAPPPLPPSLAQASVATLSRTSKESDTPPQPSEMSQRLAAQCTPSQPPLGGRPTVAPVTSEVPPKSEQKSQGRASGTYRVRTRSGAVVGPLPRAEMLALLATGRLSARSNVSIKADLFIPVSSVPALSSLAAHPAYRFRDDDAASPAWLERLDAVAAPTALYRLARGKATGLLVAVDGKRRKRIFFDKGDPIFIASTDKDELLGRRLVSAGLVPEKSVELALGSQPPFKLGEALVSFGALGAAQLVRELARQLEERLIALGAWRTGELRFFPDVTLEQCHHLRTREPTAHVLTRLVREEYPPGDIAALLRPITREILAPTALEEIIGPSLGLSPSETAVLSLVDGVLTVRDIVTRATQGGIPMADALRAVFIGLCAGAVSAVSWPPKAAASPG
jgi:serine/threonine protein kinase